MDEPECPVTVPPTAPMTEAPDAPPPSRPAYFPVSCGKLVVLSICTLGIYPMYWAWQCWEFIRIRDQRRFNSTWRAVLITQVVFNFFLFWDVFRHTGGSRASSFAWSLFLGLAYLGCWFFTSVEDGIWWGIALLSPFALVPVQYRINRFNEAEHPEHDRNGHYSLWNTAAVFVFGPLLVLTLIGSLLSDA